jgi:hypothetical protein
MKLRGYPIGGSLIVGPSRMSTPISRLYTEFNDLLEE